MTDIFRIKEYLENSSRNKIIFHNGLLNFVNYVDIGKCFSKALESKSNNVKLSLIAKEKLESIIEDATHLNIDFGKIIALKNIGILLEPELKFDFVNLIENISKSTPLFIEWNGEYDGQNIYFLSKEKGKILNIQNTSHIFI